MVDGMRRRYGEAMDYLWIIYGLFIEVEVVACAEDDVKADGVDIIFVQSSAVDIASGFEGAVVGVHTAEIGEELTADDDFEVDTWDLPSKGSHDAHFERLEVVFEFGIIETEGLCGDGIFDVHIVIDGSETVVKPGAEIEHGIDLISQHEADGGILHGEPAIARLHGVGQFGEVEALLGHIPVKVQADTDAHIEAEECVELQTASDVKFRVTEGQFIEEIGFTTEFAEQFKLDGIGVSLLRSEQQAHGKNGQGS